MNLSILLKRREARVIIIDLLMIFIVIINLSLIVFDWVFAYPAVQDLLHKFLPAFYQYYYTHIHLNFMTIDMYFVTIYLVELIARWIFAIKDKLYHRWFFYPFINWYDVLGCIPVGEFRFLRILRVVTILLRLQKLEIIDISKSYLFKSAAKYMNILVEEVSDRVVVNVLDNIQDEIRAGTPGSERVITEVIMPQKTHLVEWLSNRLQIVSENAHEAYKDDIKFYVEKRIADAVEHNKEIREIGFIPIVGSMISRNIERAIGDIVFSVVNGIIQDLASANNKGVVEHLTDLTLDTLLAHSEDDRINEMVREMVLQSIEIVKDQVKVKKWKVKDIEEREEKIKSRLKEAFE